MDKLHIPAQERSPLVDFDFQQGVFVLKGESYPDDAARVFGPIFSALDSFLPQCAGTDLRFDVELVYFNSSSAKALMNLFKMLDVASRSGVAVTVNWRFTAEDETMREFGEDFMEDLSHLTFNLVEIDEA
jgi:hypothetical protein